MWKVVPKSTLAIAIQARLYHRCASFNVCPEDAIQQSNKAFIQSDRKCLVLHSLVMQSGGAQSLHCLRRHTGNGRWTKLAPAIFHFCMYAKAAVLIRMKLPAQATRPIIERTTHESTSTSQLLLEERGRQRAWCYRSRAQALIPSPDGAVRPAQLWGSHKPSTAFGCPWTIQWGDTSTESPGFPQGFRHSGGSDCTAWLCFLTCRQQKGPSPAHDAP